MNARHRNYGILCLLNRKTLNIGDMNAEDEREVEIEYRDLAERRLLLPKRGIYNVGFRRRG